MALNLFSGGYLPLEQRCQAENLYWAISGEAEEARRADGRRPGGSAGPGRRDGGHLLLQLLAVPVVPGQLGDQAAVPGDADPPAERAPTQHAVLGDITCDSDGKIDQFIDRRDVKRTLPLHTVNGEPYYLGVFLVGAYQEILGDLHNLFGDTPPRPPPPPPRAGGGPRPGLQGRPGEGGGGLRGVQRRAPGPQAPPRRRARRPPGQDQLRRVRTLLEFYEDGLQGYTYLEDPKEPNSVAISRTGPAKALIRFVQPADSTSDFDLVRLLD